MDIAALNFTEQSDTPQAVPVLHPTTMLPLGFSLSVVGPEATLKHRFNRAIKEEMWTRAREALLAGKQPEELSDDERDLIEARAAAAVVVGWTGLTEGGADVPFSAERAVELMRKHPWLRNQVDRAHKDDQLFFGSKPTNS